MRRWATIAAFGLFLAVPLWAQHGGGHSGGGHAGGGFSGGHAGFSGGHASGGHFSGGHVSSGMHSGTRSFSHPGFSTRSFRGPIITNGFNRFNRFNRFGRGLRRWGFGYPAWGYYDPYWWWDSGSNYDEDYERDRATAAQMNAENLEEQRMLRQEEADGDQDAYAPSRSASNRNNNNDQPGAPIMPATVLVFRDQHKQEVQNYAIVGQTLWSFSPHTQRIPLADLDLTATAEANDDQGITFRIPVNHVAQ
ncbi:MAG TPA: hypothetical protein VMH04_10390 [Candidatus Solibacter sp.]|nr:hypothetical protein [Candidatus Solibacter sp.]